MRPKHILATSLLVLVAILGVLPTEVSAQARGRRGGRVVVAPSFYSPFFYRPFFYDPWFGGPWGWGPWGGAYGVGRFTNDASVRLDVRPRDAQVYVDGFFAGDVDQFDGAFQRLHVLPGQHEIAIYKDGYRTARERLYLSPNSSRKLTRDLDRLAAGEPNEPVPAPAADVEPSPEPNVAPGRSPGPPRPATPFPGRPARPGGPDGPGSPRASGVPTPSTGRGSTGAVSIRVQPDGATILIDGERWTSGDENERLIVQLPAGVHRVEVEKEGFRRATLEVEVRRGETSPLNVSLSDEDNKE